MSHLAILEPKTLMGEAVRDCLTSQPDPWEQVDLYTTDPEEVGAVTEVAGRAALVQSVEDDALDASDVILFCGGVPDHQVLDSLPGRCRSIFIDPQVPVADAVSIVAGINSGEMAGVGRIVSPAPAVLRLLHLLAPLRELGRLELHAHILQPASTHGRAGLDELFQQTRAILSLGDDRPEEVFGAQMAFNLLPWRGSSAPLTGDLETILGVDLEARIQLSQAGVFHCCSAGVFLSVGRDPGVDELQALLLENPLVERCEEPELLGPVAAATADKILVGEIAPSPVEGYWLWSCMDNLTLSAINALSIAQS